MCGFSGQLRLDGGDVDRALVRRMTQRLRHRGPDASGHYFHRHIGLGHRRLAIIDPDGGAQPMVDESGTRHLVANNEIYNYVELRRGLAARGARFRTSSDTEVLLETLAHAGPEGLKQLDGMFALALWDARGESLLLARDAFGVKPLYYYEDGSSLLFASELRSLLAYPSLDRSLDLGAVDRYFERLALPEPRSVFRRVHKLAPGHMLIARRGRIRVEPFWLPRWRTGAGSTGSPVRAMRAALDASVAMTLRSDVPVGVLLSGGVDSSSIAALAASRSRRLHTFSAAFEERDYDESAASRAVAGRLGTVHHEVLVTRDTATRIAGRLATLVDEPFADSSAIPMYAVCGLASGYVKTVMSGEGADELFAGYPWHLPANAGTTRPARTVFTRAERRRLYTRRWGRGLLRSGLRRGVVSAETVAARSRLARALHGDVLEYLPSDILFKSDRMSMAHSLEVRVPYLNRAVVDLALALPDNWRVRGQVQKYVLKRAMRSLLPPGIAARPKRGFGIPLDSWLWQKGRWRDQILDTIFAARTRARDQFDMAYLARLQRRHDRLDHLHGHQLWTVFVFESWQRAFLD